MLHDFCFSLSSTFMYLSLIYLRASEHEQGEGAGES